MLKVEKLKFQSKGFFQGGGGTWIWKFEISNGGLHELEIRPQTLGFLEN